MNDERRPRRPGPPQGLASLHAAGYGQEKLAAHFGVTRHDVRVWLKELGLQRAKGGGSKLPHRTDWPPSPAELGLMIDAYSVRAISEIYEVSRNSVRYWLQQYEIPVETTNRQTHGLQQRIPAPPVKTLQQEYVAKRRSAEDLAREYGVSSHVVARWLTECGIPVFTDNHVNSRSARLYRERRRSAMPSSASSPDQATTVRERKRTRPAREPKA